jgi:ribosome-binding factor A
MGHSNFSRIDRISALLRKELGMLVHEAVRNRQIPQVSVADVEVTRDLAHATAWMVSMSPEQGRAAVKALGEASWEFRKELARRVDLRSMPELHFRYDDSYDKGERIEQLLREDRPADSQAE